MGQLHHYENIMEQLHHYENIMGQVASLRKHNRAVASLRVLSMARPLPEDLAYRFCSTA